MNKVVKYFFDSFKAQSEINFLIRLLSLFTLYRCFYWSLDFKLLFSFDSIIYFREVNLSWWRQPVFHLFDARENWISIMYLLITVLVSILIFIRSKWQRYLFFIMWFCISNIHNKIYGTLSGGDYLYQHLLFFCCFISPKALLNYNSNSEMDKALHNLGVLAIRIQVCLVYFLAGYAKVMDTDWNNGQAVNETLMVYDYSLPLYYEGLGNLGVLFNWLVIAYQLLFPIMVWMKAIKAWYLLLGVFQHVFIALVMGLPSFGIIMIIAYFAFYVPRRFRFNKESPSII